VLLAYLRTILFESHFGSEIENTLPLSEVSNIGFEIYVLEYYITILDFLKKKFKSTLSEDETLLKDLFEPFEMRMSVMFRTEQKRIIHNQIALVN
jgi:hypothetical protein